MSRNWFSSLEKQEAHFWPMMDSNTIFYVKSNTIKTISVGKSVILEFQLSGIYIQDILQWRWSIRTLEKVYI